MQGKGEGIANFRLPIAKYRMKGRISTTSIWQSAIGNSQSSSMPLRIPIVALGSHGDVHPFLAIGKELQRRGHEVRMLMPAMFENLTRAVGLEFTPIGTIEQFEKMSSRPELWHPIKGFQVVAEGTAELLQPCYDAIVKNHAPGRTVLVLSSLGLSGRVAQEVMGLPAVSVHLQPSIFRSEIRPAKTPPAPVADWLPAWVNRDTYWIADTLVIDRVLGGQVNSFRAKFGLMPVKRIMRVWIHSPDRVIGLFPRWFAPPAPDWPPHLVLTGFPLYDEADIAPVDAGLEEFLKSGPAPIAFTAGSAMKHGDRFFAEAVGACGILGSRGLLLSRHAESVPTNLPPRIRHVEYAPFSRIFPRCAAAVHHGGIGTSAQALAAGIPHLVVPMAHDQFDNAARLKALGVGEAIPAPRFSARRAAAALRSAMDSSRAPALAEIRRRLMGINPVAQTADIIEQTFAAST
jgi:rhamnosyltransferase subunit B